MNDPQVLNTPKPDIPLIHKAIQAKIGCLPMIKLNKEK
jgi:hypothetical protein